MGSVVAWALAKKTCGRLRKSIIPLGLDCMPPNQIGHMSLNGLRRRVATCDKTQIGTWMGELYV
jgi:hypothetical protein